MIWLILIINVLAVFINLRTILTQVQDPKLKVTAVFLVLSSIMTVISVWAVLNKAGGANQ